MQGMASPSGSSYRLVFPYCISVKSAQAAQRTVLQEAAAPYSTVIPASDSALSVVVAPVAAARAAVLPPAAKLLLQLRRTLSSSSWAMCMWKWRPAAWRRCSRWGGWDCEHKWQYNMGWCIQLINSSVIHYVHCNCMCLLVCHIMNASRTSCGACCELLLLNGCVQTHCARHFCRGSIVATNDCHWAGFTCGENMTE